MGDESVQVSYTLTPDDWRVYYRFLRQDVASGDAWDRRGAARMHIWAVALFAALLGVFMSGLSVDAARVIVVGLVGTCLGLFYANFVWPRRGSDEESFVKACLSEPYATQERSLALTEDEVEETTPLGRVSFKWKMIRRIERGDEHLFIAFSNDQCFCVPLRAFESTDGADAFCQAAARFFEAHQDRGRALGFPVVRPREEGQHRTSV